jgi:protein transport protein HofC
LLSQLASAAGAAAAPGKVKKRCATGIVLTLALLVVLAMLYFVLPEFAAIYQTFNTPLPLLTRWLLRQGTC